jgi:AcrR family transcriptional regulator
VGEAVEKKTKGERTAERILDAAEVLFAERGFEGASLREITARAGIREPGLYNHFDGKQALYAAVLDRALAPMAEAMQAHVERAAPGRAQEQLPGVMTDLLLEHPLMARFFQQALQGDADAIGTRLVRRWLDRLFAQGLATMRGGHGAAAVAREELAIRIIALFNLTTGYFLSQRAMTSIGGGDLTAPENVERQKRLLRRLGRAMAAR